MMKGIFFRVLTFKVFVSSHDFHTIYREQADYVYNLSRTLCRNTDDAEDLFQESFLKAYRFLPKFRGGSVKSWLRSIVITTNISSHRGLKNQPTAALEDKEGWKDSIVENGPGPDEQLESRDTADRLRWGLAQLADDWRRVLVLRELEGLNYAEIAETLGVPVGTVRSRLARAREALRRVLEDNHG